MVRGGSVGIRSYLAEVYRHVREAGPLRVALRAGIVWVLNVVALYIMVALLPGLRATNVVALLVVTLVLGLLNALVRPAIIGVAVNLPLAVFGLIIFLLDALILLGAARFVPGIQVESIWTAIFASIGLSALTTLLTGLLHINDDDSFYRNVVRRIERRTAASDNLDRMGTIIIQIDGLAEPILRRALEEDRMPTLNRWLTTGSHRLSGWECDIPSMTSSGQAGILWGNNAGIPAFRWYDKEAGRLIVSNHPADARLLDGRQATEGGLLSDGGSSINNIFTGGGEHSVMTMSTVVDDRGKLVVAPRDFASFFVSPYNLTRLIMGVIGEVVREYWEAWRQRRHHVTPHMHRGGIFPLQRAGTNVLLQDLTVWLVVGDIQSGRLVSYCDLLGYDEVAHHAGPASPDALHCLTSIDRQLHALEKAAESAPRRYQFVVVSDHGQSWGATFRQRYGITLQQLVSSLTGTGERVYQASESGEGAGYVSATLSQIAASAGSTGRAARQVAGQTEPDEAVAIGHDRQDRAAAQSADIVVCGSGNLGLISFARLPGRLSIEKIEELHPGLFDGLIQHPGIGWVLAQSDSRGAIVLGKRGVRSLDSGDVQGEDPLGQFPEATARFLKRLTTYPTMPDIMLNSTLYDADTGEVAAFEELIGCHGGAGGLQTQPFVLFPAYWTKVEPRIEGAEAVHSFLMTHIAQREVQADAA